MSRLLGFSLISGLLLASSWPINGITPLIFVLIESSEVLKMIFGKQTNLYVGTNFFSLFYVQ